MFASLKCDELDAFIMARQDKEKAEFTAKNKIPKKGTLTEALVGARNKILIAFECRQIKIPLEISYRTTQTSLQMHQWKIISECLQYHWAKGIVCFL
jgi:hypothetical protein